MLKIREQNASNNLFAASNDVAATAGNLGLLLYVNSDSSTTSTSSADVTSDQCNGGNRSKGVRTDRVDVDCIAPNWSEITALVRLRNELASSLSKLSNMVWLLTCFHQ